MTSDTTQSKLQGEKSATRQRFHAPVHIPVTRNDDELNRRLDRIEALLNALITAQSPEYLDTEAAAGYLGISLPTLRVWLRERKFPAHRIGRLIRLKRSDLDQYVASNRRRSAVELHAIARRERP
jgi:excisionase family DNA binding protein